MGVEAKAPLHPSPSTLEPIPWSSSAEYFLSFGHRIPRWLDDCLPLGDPLMWSFENR